MKKNGALKFLEGAAVGVALAVAGSIFMASKTGKKLKKEAEAYLADFYKWISPKLKKMGKMGKAEYHEFMKNAVAQYAKSKKMSEKMAKELMEKAQKSWDHLSKHL